MGSYYNSVLGPRGGGCNYIKTFYDHTGIVGIVISISSDNCH
jgi:hypothetical protein